MMLKNSKGETICEKVKMANTIASRIVGLMFTEDMPKDEGLLISPCNSIHTFFMLFNLDVVFLDKEFHVIKVIYNMRPWRISWVYFRAHQVLEMKAGNLKSPIDIGERFEVLCIN